ncbi:MAG: ferric reductase-like transmembrane domain-containing protein [Azonexus sp.]
MHIVPKVLLGFLAVLGLAWGMQVAQTTYHGSLPWIVRQETLHLSGVLALALMSLAMLLAARLARLEPLFGGLDRMYRTHKWAGIWAGIFAGVHWLAKEVLGPYLKTTIGREGKVSREKFEGILGSLQHLAKDLGEWALYFLIIMLLIALWRRFPYRPWRHLHRVMPLIYLALLFHGVLLAPSAYWRSTIGVLLLLCGAAGTYGAWLALRGQIGQHRQIAGKVTALATPASGVLQLRCALGTGWPRHKPGQFVFVTSDAAEGAHPFTIASADRGNGEISFFIKALGDYTRGLAQRLRPGQTLRVEGPYGGFDWARRNRAAQQIWVAGGIGATPFLSWLEALQDDKGNVPGVDFHYCVQDRASDAIIQRLQVLCAALPQIRLHLHGSAQGERLRAAQLDWPAGMPAEIWMCGPSGLATALQQGLRQMGRRDWSWHQEAFAMR